MVASGRVQEGAGGRTYVSVPPDPASFPSGRGLYVQFNVPSKALLPAGQPDWKVMPGPNVGTKLYGPPPTMMPPATCISVVCSR
ncbi:hypothetical protein [Curtobacterium sp. L1-20]|uniref:TreTu family toxin n=1 Tax=Curtobacterium sp. L1-20 TaxID=3138181 RepID=UPI003B51CE2E